MARINFVGFELGSNANNIEFAVTNNFNVNSTHVRSGSWAGNANCQSGVKNFGMTRIVNGASSGPYFGRVYLFVNVLPSAETSFVVLSDTTALTTARMYITVDGSGILRCYDGVGQVGSNSTAISINTWYRIEWQFKAGGGGTSVIAASLDGIFFANDATRTNATGIQAYGYGANLKAETVTLGKFWFDDIALNDSTGSFQNSYPGDGRITRYLPNATGDFAQWTRGGTTDTGTNWGQLATNDSPTPDDAGSFNTSNTLNQKDLVNVTNTGAEIGANDVINVVGLGVRYAGASSSANATFGLLIESSSGGTNEQSPNVTPAQSVYRSNNETVLFNMYMLYGQPGSSGATPWTKSALDTTQIGYIITATNTNGVNITSEWIYVDSTAGVAGNANNTYKTLLGVGNI